MTSEVGRYVGEEGGVAERGGVKCEALLTTFQAVASSPSPAQTGCEKYR